MAEKLNLPLAEPQRRPMKAFSEQHSELWTRLAQQQGLRETRIEGLGDWQFADYIIGCDWDIAASTVKARLHGFHDCRDSLEMWATRIDDMQREKILPTL